MAEHYANSLLKKQGEGRRKGGGVARFAQQRLPRLSAGAAHVVFSLASRCFCCARLYRRTWINLSPLHGRWRLAGHRGRRRCDSCLNRAAGAPVGARCGRKASITRHGGSLLEHRMAGRHCVTYLSRTIMDMHTVSLPSADVTCVTGEGGPSSPWRSLKAARRWPVT